MVTSPSVPPYSSTTSAIWICVDCMRISRFATGMDGGTKMTGRRSLIEAMDLERSTRPRSGDAASVDVVRGDLRPLAGHPQRGRLNVSLACGTTQCVAHQPAHQILDVHHAARIIERLAKQRNTRHACCIECLQQLPDRLALVNGDDVGARHHHVSHAQGAKPEDAQQHLALLQRERLAFPL